MPRRLVSCFLLFISLTAAAQTNVTTSGGTSNQVPKFTGSSTIGDSAIAESGGNVGVGTSAPLDKLDVRGNLVLGNSGGAASAFFQATGVGGRNYRWISTDNTYGAGGGKFSIFDDTASAYRFTLDSAGNVGLGTTTPLDKLDVRGNLYVGNYGGGANLYMQATGTGGRNYRWISTDDTYSAGGGRFSVFDDTAGAYRFTVDGSGNVGIGTTSPAYKLSVGGTIQSTTGGFRFPDGTTQTTAAYNTGGTITGVTTGMGITGGGTSGTVSLAVDSTVARTNASQSLTGNQTVYGNLEVGIVNGTGGGFSANGGAWVSNNYGGTTTPFSIYCTYVYNGPCWTIDQYGNSATTSHFYAYSLTVPGAKQFTIDHPLDPANKYLVHASIESSDIKNLYDGITTLDNQGEAWVILPDWFQTLNRDFRYQLTSIGAPAPGLFIATEIENNRFRIAGGQPNGKVSWTVTGIRQDAYAKAHPMQVEVDKADAEKGLYIDATVYGLSPSLTLPLPPMRLRAPKN